MGCIPGLTMPLHRSYKILQNEELGHSGLPAAPIH